MHSYRGTLRPVYRLAALAIVCTALLIAIAPGQAATPPARLLARYEPVMYFDPQERFLPAGVQSFVADSDLERLVAGAWAVADPDPGPGDLPGPGTGTWRLNQDTCTPAAALGGLDCYAAAWRDGSSRPTLYGRVVRQNDRFVLQYWYFYYDDVYSYQYPPSDLIWQAHEGDWEVVNVVLSDRERPLFVGYSQHCKGEGRSWSDTPRFEDGTHPIVHVGIGSHANYFEAGVHPISTSCIPAAVVGFFNQNGLPLPNDYTFAGGAVAGPPEADGSVMRIHKIRKDRPKWIAYTGFWGELQYFHAPGITAALGTSPVGPAYHTVWVDPLGTLATWS